MGLAGLTDRVESLGGSVRLGNRRGGGAELVMSLDLEGAE
jgi:signal transduction histidine kinase